jgi:serine/threonine protein kinase
MGKVYCARDMRLDRTIAIKILPSHLADNPEAKERFGCEARSISSLSHPNLCHLYDIGVQDGTSDLVMDSTRVTTSFPRGGCGSRWGTGNRASKGKTHRASFLAEVSNGGILL